MATMVFETATARMGPVVAGRRGEEVDAMDLAETASAIDYRQRGGRGKELLGWRLIYITDALFYIAV